MSGKAFSYVALTILSAALVATAFILVLTHNSGTCTYTLNGGDRKDCIGSFDFLCAGPALTVDVTLKDSIFETHKICPWREPTSVLMYVAFGFSMLFLVSLGLTLWTKSFNLINIQFVFGFFALAALIATMVLMIIDMITGDKARENFYLAYISAITGQTVFRVNAAMVCLAILTMGLLMVATFTRYRASAKEIVRDQEVPFHPMTA